MLLTVDLTDIDLIFCVILTDKNFQNIFVMVTVVLKQTYLSILEKVKGSEFLQKYKEDQWITCLDTIYPHGLNMHLSDFRLLYSSLFKQVWTLCFIANFMFVQTWYNLFCEIFALIWYFCMSNYRFFNVWLPEYIYIFNDLIQQVILTGNSIFQPVNMHSYNICTIFVLITLLSF